MTASVSGAVDQFVEAINAHDLERLAILVAPGHRFIDSLGNVIVGRERVCEAWKHYFNMVADYRIAIEWMMSDLHAVSLFGLASGSLSGPAGSPQAWSTPIAVRATVEGDLVAEWRVFADNEPVRAILRQLPAV